MLMDRGIISVIIATYNRSDMLCESIESVLLQTYKEFEIIIVDDCSTDKTKQIVLKYHDKRIHYMCNEKNEGCGYSRRRGYLASRGEYIVFLDSDDYYIDYDWFKCVIGEMRNSENINLVCADARIKFGNDYKDEKLNIDSVIGAYKYLEKFQIKYKKPISTFTTVFKKEYLEKSHIEEVEMMNDSVIFMRSLLSGGDVLYVPQCVGVYREHEGNISKGLNLPFVIKNLEEKKRIKDVIIKNKILDNVDFWWKEQIRIQLEFYCRSCNDKNDIKVALKWCRKNMKKYYARLYREILLVFYKKKLLQITYRK